MVARTKIKATPSARASRVAVGTDHEEPETKSVAASYFADSRERTSLEFVSSGCTLLDQVLGGGYALGRMSNLIGDKSTGKTLLAIEACANFARQYEDGRLRYLEAESAFDKGYAAALGMPVDRVEFVGDAQMVDKKGNSDRTVEFWYEDLRRFMADLKGRPGLYVVDSLDALSDRAELERDISDGSYGGAKPKKIGELFRRLVGEIEKSRVLLLVISQIRDKIGVTFGETKMRAGGRAMDFYATHCLWLAQIETLKKTVAKIDRPIGVTIRAKCKKNKIGLPFRECDFPLLFGYGIDDLTAGVEWLLDSGREELLADLDLTKAGYKLRLGSLRNKGGQEVRDLRKALNALVVREWATVEAGFLPKAGKY